MEFGSAVLYSQALVRASVCLRVRTCLCRSFSDTHGDRFLCGERRAGLSGDAYSFTLRGMHCVLGSTLNLYYIDVPESKGLLAWS
jgi:hypothetical protein